MFTISVPKPAPEPSTYDVFSIASTGNTAPIYGLSGLPLPVLCFTISLIFFMFYKHPVSNSASILIKLTVDKHKINISICVLHIILTSISPPFHNFSFTTTKLYLTSCGSLFACCLRLIVCISIKLSLLQISLD